MQERAELSDRQMAFVREYVKDSNGTQAAIRAGYSPNGAFVTASRLLSNVKVKSEVDKLAKKLSIESETDAKWVRRRLKEEAEDFSEFASHSARIRAIELIGKLNGDFKDGPQTTANIGAININLNFASESPAKLIIDGDSSAP